jgi:DNA-binding Lrp family transcriptional regulator
MFDQLSTVDRKLLKLLLGSEGTISSHELSEEAGVPVSTVQRRRKHLEDEYILKHYAINPLKFGFRKVDLLIYTGGGGTMDIGRELMKREEVTYVARTIGEHTIDLRVEVFIRDNALLLNLLEDVKGMQGVRDVVWSEVVEEIGRKPPPNNITI